MILHGRQLSALGREGLWVAGGQGLSALGLIIGIRLQTEYIPPDIFGRAVLVVGLSSLLVGIICQPLAQGALRFLPEFTGDRQRDQFRWLIWSLAARYVAWASLFVLSIGIGWKIFAKGKALMVVLICGLMFVDSARTIQMAFFNAVRRQQVYAGWAAAEAWGRPLFAVMFVLLFGASSEAVLGGYCLSSGINFALFGCQELIHASKNGRGTELSQSIGHKLKHYSRPLIPLGIVGWLTSLSDRYLIAAILGVNQAGIYSAIYGLISRPFLIAQSILELTLRPVYLEALAAGDKNHEWQLYRRWLILNTVAGLLLLAAFVGGSGLIVENLLGERYSNSITLVPYLAIGHVFLIIAYNLGGYLLAHQHTREIFLISCATAVISIVFVAIFTSIWGIIGAAAACIAYFGIQAFSLALFIWSRERKSRSS